MIPSNILISQLLPLNELTVQPASPVDSISDKLSNLIPGQRVLAEIQARLPNGAYRAAIGQRDVTLSLNFAAKPGDSLELEVVENNGHLALAVAGKTTTPSTAPAPEGVATTLSKTGQFISSLLPKPGEADHSTPVTPLNKGQPLTSGPTIDASLLAPRLQQAVEGSGLFYEAHLARWTFGDNNVSEQQLRQEPQGQLSTPFVTNKIPVEADPVARPLAESKEAAKPPSVTHRPDSVETSDAAIQLKSATTSSPTTGSNNLVANELTPLVQQQLATLDSQALQWQGQIIPGQNMFWEIIKEENDEKKSSHSDTPTTSWRTRLKLHLPELGDIDARLHIQGEQIGATLLASDAQTREKLYAAQDELRKSLAATGLTLTTLGVSEFAADPVSSSADVGHAT